MDIFLKENYCVKETSLVEAQELVKLYHYSKGGSNTRVYVHGLYEKPDKLIGVAWWLPPTRVACESISKDNWKRVLGLTRLVIVPGIPKNACSFLLAKSIKLIKEDKRFDYLVTYADEAMGHTGTVYRASNWTYIGRTGPYTRWVDKEGRQVSAKSTKNRVKSEMLALGHVKTGNFYKHKYTMTLI